MLKMIMLVSKERKSTRFFHSFFDIAKQRRAWTEVETVIGKAESQPCRRCSQNRRKTQTESGDRPEEKRLTSVPTEFIAIFLILSQKGLISNRRNFGLFAPKSMRSPSKDRKSKDLSF